MGTTKPVALRNGLAFNKEGDANAFFKNILNGGELGVYLDGEEHAAVDALFRDYCDADQWPMPGSPQRYFRDWNRAEERTTRSFFVEYDNGVDDFSYLKAVRAIANWKRS